SVVLSNADLEHERAGLQAWGRAHRSAVDRDGMTKPAPVADQVGAPTNDRGETPATPPPTRPASPARPSSGAGPLGGGTAGELFRAANAARRAGDVPGASALYAQLQSAFPSSDEARVSHVSMGKLLLDAGRASEAERQFAHYLALGRGELAE